MAAVPSIGRANRVEGATPAEADLTHALYEEYAAQIFRYCLHQLGSREEAEDAVQSTFLNAFRGLKRGVVPEAESAWLFKIAHNVCLSRRRSTWRRGRVESPADFELVEELAPAPQRRADELIGLQDVLEQMPEQQRRAILLREWQGLSYREISEELELSQAAVETLIFRARRALAAGLEQPPVARRRARRGAGLLGNLLSSAQSFLFGGGAAIKVAATVAVVGAGTVVAAAPVVHRHGPAAPPQPIAPAVRLPVLRHAPPAADRAVPRPDRRPAPAVPHLAPPGHARGAAPASPALAAPAPAATATTTEPPPVPARTTESQAAQAPGRAKQGDAQAGSPPPGGRAAAPGQVKQQDAVAHGRATAPGQAKKQDGGGPPAGTPAAQPPAAAGSTPAPVPAPAANGNAGGAASGNPGTPPGQTKKDDPPAVAAPPDPVSTVVTTAASTIADGAAAATGHGNGNGNGNGNGKPGK